MSTTDARGTTLVTTYDALTAGVSRGAKWAVAAGGVLP